MSEMSEMSEVRRDDVRRDEMSGEVPAEASLGDVRSDDRSDDDRLGDVHGDDRSGDDGLGDVRGEAVADDLGGRRETGPAGQAQLSTDQIANPGAAQAAAPTPGGGDTADDGAAQLLDPQDREAMTQRWRDIQADFVDQPRKAMQDADALVAGLMQQLAQMFSQERSQLEAQWSRGDQVSTEDLRVSLQRYRAFFERLLSV
jgi:hypothetical protein